LLSREPDLNLREPHVPEEGTIVDTARIRHAWLAAVCRAALAALMSPVPLRPQVETGFAAGRDGSFWVTR
jgi:hypothetical protein